MLKVWNVFLVDGGRVARDVRRVPHALGPAVVGAHVRRVADRQVVLRVPRGAGRRRARRCSSGGSPQLRTPTTFGSAVSKEATFLAEQPRVRRAPRPSSCWGRCFRSRREAFFGEQQAVGPPFFNRVFAPIAALLLLLVVVRDGRRRGAAARSRASRRASRGRRAIATVVAGRRARRLAPRRRSPASCGSRCCSPRRASPRSRARDPDARHPRHVFARNPRRYGGYIVHLGVAIMVIGFAGSLGRTQTEVIARPGDTLRVRRVHVHLRAARAIGGPRQGREPRRPRAAPRRPDGHDAASPAQLPPQLGPAAVGDRDPDDAHARTST